jgi:hypothetical protein
VYFGCFFAIECDGVSLAHVQNSPNQLLSLEGALLLKAASGLLVVLSLVHHINLSDFFKLVGCQGVCLSLYGSRSRGRRGGRILLSLRNGTACKCIIFMKLLDFTIAGFLWVALMSAYRQTVDPPKEVATLLGLVFATQILASIVAPILKLVVFWCAKLIANT